MAAGEGYDEQLRELRAEGLSIDRQLLGARRRRHRQRRRPAPPGLRRVRAGRRVRLGRGVARPRARDRRDDRAGRGAVHAPRPAERHDQDPRRRSRASPRSRETIAAGINVNVTLIFWLARHDAVIEAYLTGLERLVAAGGDLSTVVVGRVVLREPGRHRDRPPPPRRPRRCAARPRSRTPSSRTSCSACASPGARWDALAAKGARLQRPLWASTSTKNPAYSPTLYVDDLVGPRHREHARAGVDRGAAQGRRRTCGRHRGGGRRRGRARDHRARGARASTSTTSPRRSSARASPRSPPASTRTLNATPREAPAPRSPER